jgi:uncharacterized protein
MLPLALDLAALKAAAVYVSLVVLMGVVLTALVVNQRRTKKIGIGDGGDKTAARLIRVHANYCEYAPFALALMVMLPLIGAGAWTVHLVGLMFLTGRVAHAIGLSGSAGHSTGRLFGMILTLTALMLGAAALLWLAATVR